QRPSPRVDLPQVLCLDDGNDCDGGTGRGRVSDCREGARVAHRPRRAVTRSARRTTRFQAVRDVRGFLSCTPSGAACPPRFGLAHYSSCRRNRSELAITLTDDSDMAAAAMTGD